MSENNENKVKFGLCNVHVAKMIENNGVISYDTPFKVPGSVSLSADPDGDVTTFYADNVKYYISNANNGYTGDLEIADTPKKFKTDILGQREDTNGAIVESSDDNNAQFALMGEIIGDKKKRRFVYYNCTAKRISTTMKTTENSKDPQTDKLSLTMAPRTTDNLVKATMEPSESNTAAYNSFYTSVFEPTFSQSV